VVWEPRTYRRTVSSGDLVAFEVAVSETDLQILATCDVRVQAEASVRAVRAELESYVARHPRFAESFVPVPIEASAPAIVRAMAEAAESAGVGPMAAVAGAVAERVARDLSAYSEEVIVENGGDLFLIGRVERTVALWTGSTEISGVGIVVPATMLPVAVATSSATIGPSVSLGRADSATVIATSGALADAAASVLGNRTHGTADIEAALAATLAIPGVLGAVVAVEGALGATGDVRLAPIADS
jgi:hypothetical protein